MLFSRANYELSDSVVATGNWALPANTNWNDVDTMTIPVTTTVVCDLVCMFTCWIDGQFNTTGAHSRFKFVMDVTDSESYDHYGDTPRRTTHDVHTVFEAVAAGAHTVKVQIQRDTSTPAANMVSRRLTLLIRPQAI
jgi:hypothetical protein